MYASPSFIVSSLQSFPINPLFKRWRLEGVAASMKANLNRKFGFRASIADPCEPYAPDPEGTNRDKIPTNFLYLFRNHKIGERIFQDNKKRFYNAQAQKTWRNATLAFIPNLDYPTLEYNITAPSSGHFNIHEIAGALGIYLIISIAIFRNKLCRQSDYCQIYSRSYAWNVDVSIWRFWWDIYKP